MFAVSDPKTAKYLSDKIGETEYYEAENTLSFGVGDNRDGESLRKTKKTEPLVLKSELMNLPDLTAFVKIPNNPKVMKTKLNYRYYPPLSSSFVIRDDLVLDQILAKQTEITAEAEYYQHGRGAGENQNYEEMKENDYPGYEEEFNF